MTDRKDSPANDSNLIQVVRLLELIEPDFPENVLLRMQFLMRDLGGKSILDLIESDECLAYTERLVRKTVAKNVIPPTHDSPLVQILKQIESLSMYINSDPAPRSYVEFLLSNVYQLDDKLINLIQTPDGLELAKTFIDRQASGAYS